MVGVGCFGVLGWVCWMSGVAELRAGYWGVGCVGVGYMVVGVSVVLGAWCVRCLDVFGMFGVLSVQCRVACRGSWHQRESAPRRLSSSFGVGLVPIGFGFINGWIGSCARVIIYLFLSLWFRVFLGGFLLCFA